MYATVGIPLFMILLNDFGKYFTWRIKFMVAFLRRLGNTSSLGRIYRQVYVQVCEKGNYILLGEWSNTKHWSIHSSSVLPYF